MMASLAWGAKNYSTGVLENQLRYYVLRNGTVAYRGIELPQSARGLTVMAQYYRQTGDPEGLIVKYRCGAHFLQLVSRSDYDVQHTEMLRSY